MKHRVHDDLVAEYAKLLRSGGPVGQALPYPLGECDFTEEQRNVIREARKERKQLIKAINPKPAVTSPPNPKPIPVTGVPRLDTKSAAVKKSAPTTRSPVSKQQTLSILEKLLFPAAPKLAAPKPAAPKPISPAPKVSPTKPATLVPATKSPSLTKLEKMLYLQGGKCFFCGETLTLAEANIEHLYPLSKGGTRTEDNEVVCHKTLNETFGNLPLKDKFEFVLKHSGSFRCPKK